MIDTNKARKRGILPERRPTIEQQLKKWAEEAIIKEKQKAKKIFWEITRWRVLQLLLFIGLLMQGLSLYLKYWR